MPLFLLVLLRVCPWFLPCMASRFSWNFASDVALDFSLPVSFSLVVSLSLSVPLFLFLFLSWALSVGLDLSRLQHVQNHLCCTHNEFRHSLDHPRLFDSLFQRDAAHDVLMLVFFHRNEFDCFFSYCLRVHSGLHSHEVRVHCKWWAFSTRLRSSSCALCPSCNVCTSLRTERVLPHALLFPSVLVCSWVLPSHASLTLPTLPRCLLLQLTFRPLLLQLHSTLSPQLLSMFCHLLLHLHTKLPAFTGLSQAARPLTVPAS